jgi:hypothetical protein
MRARRLGFAAIGQAATVVGLLGGVIGLVFLARPGCQPQAPANVSSAEIGDADIEPGVTFRHYLVRASSPAGTLSREQLRKRGVLVVLHYSIQGYRGKGLSLRWNLFEADGEPVADGRLVVKPKTDADAFDGYVWVTPRDPQRSYYVVATLLQPDGQLALDSFKTDEFVGVEQR